VAASLGPYGAALADGSEYTGYQNVSMEQLMDFHKRKVSTYSANRSGYYCI
jgi:homocysteine S-methyltransferase